MNHEPTKITIVGGSGNVGSVLAYMLAQREEFDISLATVDERGKEKIHALSHDIMDAGNSSSLRVAPLEECVADTDILILGAGESAKGRPRPVLRDSNKKITEKIMNRVLANNPNQSFTTLVYANPLDYLVYFLVKEFGLKASQVVGMGGVLDSSRFRNVLKESLQLNPINDSHIIQSAMMCGEHGDTGFGVWSRLEQAGLRVFSEDTKEKIISKTKNRGFEIFSGKGCTSYGPASAVLQMIENIRRKDPTKIFSASIMGETNTYNGICEDVALSLPVHVTKNGNIKITELDFSISELKKLEISVTAIKQMISGVSV